MGGKLREGIFLLPLPLWLFSVLLCSAPSIFQGENGLGSLSSTLLPAGRIPRDMFCQGCMSPEGESLLHENENDFLLLLICGQGIPAD